MQVEVSGVVVNNLRARDLMSCFVKTVQPDTSVLDAAAIMDAGGYSQLPVVEGRKPVALLTEADVRRALIKHRRKSPVREAASPLPSLVTPDAHLSEVLHELSDQDSILVVADTGELSGIITYWDILLVARPFLMVSEVELLLRNLVAAAYQKAYGPDWWHKVDEHLRRRAEEEHAGDGVSDPSGQHMLGHTSFWALIETFRDVAPHLPGERFEHLHSIREMRNRVAHHYQMTPDEVRRLVRECMKARDWLEQALEQYR